MSRPCTRIAATLSLAAALLLSGIAAALAAPGEVRRSTNRAA